MNVREFG